MAPVLGCPSGHLDLPLALGSKRPDEGLVATTADAVSFLRVLHDDPKGPLETMTGCWRRLSRPGDRAALLTPGPAIQYSLGTMRGVGRYTLHVIARLGLAGSGLGAAGAG